MTLKSCTPWLRLSIPRQTTQKTRTFHGKHCHLDNGRWLQKVKARIEQIATVETVENARRNREAARSHGDLRENAEFKSALEKPPSGRT